MFALNAYKCRRLRTTKLSAWHKTAAILSAAVAGVLGLTGHVRQAHADLNWDPSGVTPTGSDGLGTWNLTTPEWGNNSSDSAWINGNTGAIFGIGGAGGTITLGTNIVSGNLTFNSSGYSITGNLANDGILTLASATNTITTNFNATINGPLVGSTGFTKNGTGTLTFGSGALQYFNGGVVTVNAGSIVLNATNNNFLAYVATNATTTTDDIAASQSSLNLGTNAVTLDLGGASPIFGRVGNNATFTQVASAGIVTNSNTNVMSTFTVAPTNGTFTDFFSGTVTGNVALTYAPTANSNSWTLASAQTYTGPTTIQSGTMVLGGGAIGFNGQIQSSTGITNYANLTLDNTNGNVNNRIASTIPLTMYGSALTINGNSAASSSQILSTVTLGNGISTVTVNPGAGGTNSLILGNLVQGTAPAAVVFSGSNLGSTSVGNPANVTLNQVNGSTNILTNNLIGSWAYVVNGTNINFATLNSNNIVGAMGDTADGFTDYTRVTTLSSATATGNYLYTGTASGLSGSKTVNSLNISGTAGAAFAFSTLLTLGSGGLIVNNVTADQFAPSGSITAGTSSAGFDLNLYYGSQQTTGLWQASIVNNGTNAVSLVKNGPGTLKLYSNTLLLSYTGSTIINQGTLLFDTAPNGTNTSALAGGGPVVINNSGTLAISTSNALNPNSTVTVNGGGVLQFSTANVTNRVSTLVLNDAGGTAAPLIKIIGSGTTTPAALVVTNRVTSTNNDPSQVPLIDDPNNQGGALDLGGGNVTFDMEGTAPVSLQIGNGNANGWIQNGSITKTGPGVLVLNLGSQTSYSGMTINQGAVRLDTNINGGGYDLPAGATATVNSSGTLLLNNSFGNGPQEFAGNVTLSGGTLGLVCNNDLLYGNVTISSNGGTVNLGDYYNPTIGHTVTISGTGGGSLQGAGSLTLIGATIPTNTASLTLTGNANSFSGAITLMTNATLVSQAQQGYGNTFGTGTITFANTSISPFGGTLNILDNGGSGTGAANSSLGLNGNPYGNNVVVAANSTLNVGNVTGSTNIVNNVLPLGVMTFSNNATLALNTNANYSLTLTGLHGGGTIALAGTNNVAVTVTGVVSPSDPQKLNVNNLAFGSGGTNNTYTAVINVGSGSNSAGAGTNYDQINVTGAAALNVNSATLNIMDPTYTPNAGDEFFLINESATSTAFGQVEFNGSVVAPDGNGNYDIGLDTFGLSYTGNEATGATTGGNDVVLDVVSVPEPSVLGLLALGGMGLLARRRRRTTQRN